MNISKASEIFSKLSSQAANKSEKKVYNCFSRTLSALSDKDLTAEQTKVIQEKLASMQLEGVSENRKKFYKQKLNEFTAFLKNEFSFTSKSHFMETWMIYGMIFGTGIGMVVGSALDAGVGTSIGLSIGTGVGMSLGILYGARKDAEAKRLGKVL